MTRFDAMFDAVQTAFRKQWALSAVASVLAVAFRQNNIVWCIFAGGVCFLQQAFLSLPLFPASFADFVRLAAVSSLRGPFQEIPSSRALCWPA